MAEQPTQKEFKAVDIVDYAMSSQPIRVNDAFDSIIADKVISSLATRKQDVSAQMFNDKQETPAEEIEILDGVEQLLKECQELLEISNTPKEINQCEIQDEENLAA